ncbi:MAG: NAD(P)/FAD-dependent oxidoreductase [Comamonadaceae bacterium]|nr:MAG: NAD(P)/FAD-dependent oxidoreductase [Comamonadaceae bacterium]
MGRPGGASPDGRAGARRRRTPSGTWLCRGSERTESRLNIDLQNAPTSAPPSTAALERLAQQARHELALFDYPPREWVPPRFRDGQQVLDVVIVGGGQNGVGAAAGLQQARVPNLLMLDENAEGREGPWVTYARMITLRTIKTLPGPALKVPALAFQSWFEAQHGAAAWEALVRIPKQMWMAYLGWLRRTLSIPTLSEARLELIEPAEGLLRLTVRTPAGTRQYLTRKVVLATGSTGAGGRNIPAFVERKLPRDRWAHSAEAIDFAALAGKDVAVLGAGASAFDNAATALEAGAARVDLYMRRAALPEMNSARFMEFEGLYRHFADMDNLTRWRFMRKIFASPMPPPPDTFLRTTAFPNFHLHFASAWDDVGLRADGRIELSTPSGNYPADFAILGTGFAADLSRRGELAAVLPHVALWGDRFTPPPGEASPAIARFPFLGPGFELTERTPGACPELMGIHMFNGAALPSMGPIGLGINGMAHGTERLVRGITRDFYLQDAERFCAEFLAYDVPEARLVPAPSAMPSPSPT